MNDMIFLYIGEEIRVHVWHVSRNATCDYYAASFCGNDTSHVYTVPAQGFNGYTRREIIGKMLAKIEQKFPLTAWALGDVDEPEWFENEWQPLTDSLIIY